MGTAFNIFEFSQGRLCDLNLSKIINSLSPSLSLTLFLSHTLLYCSMLFQ